MKSNPDKFKWQPGQVVLSQCVYCKHKSSTQPNVCAAFPHGIPADILENHIDHRQAQPGDNGIQFEQRAGGPDAPFDRMFPT